MGSEEQIPPPGQEGQPTEEELRAAMEEEVRKLRVPDLLLQAAASVLNLSARRIGKEDERDLDQARTGIDAVKAIVPYLDEEPAGQVQQAVSELQIAFAQVARGGEPGPEGGGHEGEPAAAPPSEPAAAKPQPPKDSGLWVPPGTK